MSQRNVISLLKDALKRQQLNDFSITRSDVARYLLMRYKSTVEEEEEEQQSDQAKSKIQKFLEPCHQTRYFAKQAQLLLAGKPAKNDSEIKKNTITILQSLPGSQIKGKNTLLIQRSGYNTNDDYESIIPEPKKFISERNLVHKFKKPPSKKEIKEIKEIKEKKNDNNTDRMKKPPSRGPWPKYLIATKLPSITNQTMEPIKKIQKFTRPQTCPSKLAALGEATLRAVRERKEKKERAVAIAKMEVRQAKIAELKARAEAALNRAKELLQGV